MKLIDLRFSQLRIFCCEKGVVEPSLVACTNIIDLLDCKE